MSSREGTILCPTRPTAMLDLFAVSREVVTQCKSPSGTLPPLAHRSMAPSVESRTGAVAWDRWPAPRFPSSLIEADVPISGIRLSDWLHCRAHHGTPPAADT